MELLLALRSQTLRPEVSIPSANKFHRLSKLACREWSIRSHFTRLNRPHDM